MISHGCKCEVAQTADEFDYLPRPRIDSVSTSGGPTTLASEHGGSVITVKGVGLNPLDIDWANFGDPTAGLRRSRSATCSCRAPRCRSPPLGVT